MSATSDIQRPVSVVHAQSPLSRLVSRPMVCVPPGSSVQDAADAMRAHAVSSVVLDDLGGIVTERDIARAVAAGYDVAEPVDGIAERHPVVCAGAIPVVDAAALMLNEHVRHLIVDLGDNRSGVLSMRDVLAVLLQASDQRLWLTSLRIAISAPAETWLG